ncbi:MAG: hypothetical protein KME54_27205 [Tolypothrix brevis GSE-NOS-MK-07-07A]|jgi:hypothetical protein|nr:hypothetical protein [Tolypothrix brevis GSE-NOS-MK-07-07A]
MPIQLMGAKERKTLVAHPRAPETVTQRILDVSKLGAMRSLHNIPKKLGTTSSLAH